MWVSIVCHPSESFEHRWDCSRSSLICVYTVCTGLSVRKVRIITVPADFRFTFWQLIVFIEQDGSIVDAEVESPLDRNELHKLINYTTINGKSCELVDLPTVETVQYASLFSFYTTTPIRYEDILEVQEYLESIWTTTAFLSTGVVVKIVTQEDSISSAGYDISSKFFQAQTSLWYSHNLGPKRCCVCWWKFSVLTQNSALGKVLFLYEIYGKPWSSVLKRWIFSTKEPVTSTHAQIYDGTINKQIIYCQKK